MSHAMNGLLPVGVAFDLGALETILRTRTSHVVSRERALAGDVAVDRVTVWADHWRILIDLRQGDSVQAEIEEIVANYAQRRRDREQLRASDRLLDVYVEPEPSPDSGREWLGECWTVLECARQIHPIAFFDSVNCQWMI